MTNFKAVGYEVASDLVNLGITEDGEQNISSRYFMVAEDKNGYRKVWGWFETESACELGFEFIAPAVEEWDDYRPAYGSIAFEELGEELNDLVGEMEADLGPNWINYVPFDHPARIHVGR